MPILYLFLSLFLINESKPKPPLKIAVLYYATIDPCLKTELVKNITATYNCNVAEIKETASMPKEAYYKPRNRYRADELLKDLKTYTGCDKIIGITNKDISTTKNNIYDWGIMGLANC